MRIITDTTTTTHIAKLCVFGSGIFLVLLFLLSLQQTTGIMALDDSQIIQWEPCTEHTPEHATPTSSRRGIRSHDPSNNNKKELDDQVRNMIHNSKYLSPVSTVRFMEKSRSRSDQHGSKSRSISTNQQQHVVECALISVPFQWNSPRNADRKIKIFVKRFRIPDRNPKGQLWLLQGGPGSPGNVFDGIAGAYQDYLDDEYDLYLPDHRGTGRSTLLKCDAGTSLDNNDPDIVRSCLNQLKRDYNLSEDNDLSAFGTSNAARDVMHVAQLSKLNHDEQLIVYGVSYGTYWLNRILTLFPNQVDVAIADSVVKTSMDFAERDDHFLEAGNRFLQVCAESLDCNGRFLSQFGAGVQLILNEVFERQRYASSSDSCLPETYTPMAIQRTFGTLLANKDFRRLIFPIVYRLRRCSEDDKLWLNNVAQLVRSIISAASLSTANSQAHKESSSVNGPALFSSELFAAIVTGELMQYPLRPSEHWPTKYLMSPPYFWVDLSQQISNFGSGLQHDRYFDSFSKLYPSQHTKPLLIMQGTLDPQTPYSFAQEWITFSESTNLQNTYFVSIPNAVHGLVFSTPSERYPRFVSDYCGSKIMLDFIKEPNKYPSLDCIPRTEDYMFNFNLVTNQLTQITGSVDLWEGGAYAVENNTGSDKRPSNARTILISLIVMSIVACLFV